MSKYGPFALVLVLLCSTLDDATAGSAAERIVFEALDGRPAALIERDSSGIPTVSAQSLSGGYAGLCYAMAQDRLWQMDFLRRLGQGRLAEIFGNDPEGATVGGDIVNRTLGLARIAKAKVDAAPLKAKIVMTSCSAGINAWIERAKANNALPPEFGIFGYEPEPWRAEDSLTVLAALVSSLDQITAFTKINRAVLGAIFGPEVASRLIIDQIDGLSLFDRRGNFNDPRIFLQDFIGGLDTTAALERQRSIRSMAAFKAAAGKRLASARGLRDALHALAAHRPLLTVPATNMVVVSGAHSSTGEPILENDFHLPNFTPSLIYLARLNIAGRFQLKGKFVPSFPGAIGGRNDKLVWGVTFAILDTADFYMERLSESGEKVYYRNRLVPVQTRSETIRIAGAEPLTITVRTTPHGPIISDAIPPLQMLGTLALQTTYAQPEWAFDGFFDLHEADTISKFRLGLRRQSIGLNYGIADARGRDGNIAYQLAGLAPQRNVENTFVPVRGDNGAHEWHSYARQSELPFVRNPAAGFLAVTNNRIVPEDYAPRGRPIYLSRYGDQPYRTRRAAQLMTARIDNGSKVSLGDMSAIPSDPVSAVTPAMARIFADVIAAAGLPDDLDPARLARLQAMQQDLQTFDGDSSPQSRAQIMFHTLLHVSLKNLILDLFPNDPALGRDIYVSYTRDVVVNSRMLALVGLLKNPQPPFFGAIDAADAVSARNRAMIRSLLEAESLLVTQFGADMSAWRWGAVHVLVSTHPLSQAIPPFGFAPAPFAGDSTTLNFGGFFNGGAPFSKGAQLLALPADELFQRGGLFAVFFPEAIAAERVVWDVENRRNDIGVLSTGQSGSPPSPHWADMRERFVNGSFMPF